MIAFHRVSKSFPGVQALREVSFSIARGECHALLGENGAGKSTLGKILAGIYSADSGQITLEEKPVSFSSPREALIAGVGIVHQELVFCPNLSVAENLCLHDLPRVGSSGSRKYRWWNWDRLDRKALRQRAENLLAQLDLDGDVEQPLGNLTIAQEQMVQIAAAVGLGAKVLVFDEPTSSLGAAEVEQLFRLLRRLHAEGVTMIYVSHRLEEIFALCQTVTVLRDGQHVATRPLSEVDQAELVRLMVGRTLEEPVTAPDDLQPGPLKLRTRDLRSPGKFQAIDLELHQGEIVGLAGLVGAGRTELAEALFGLDHQVQGTIENADGPITIPSPRAALERGIGLVPEDRKRHGLVLSLSIRENLTLPILDHCRGFWGAVHFTRQHDIANDYCQRLGVRAPNVETPTRQLSGGNQQKIVLAKWLAARCGILLIDEPTRGVDVAAKREMHQLIVQLARDGVAILLISSDLPELLALSTRLVVLRQGRISGQLSRAAATPEAVLRLMAGI